MKGIPTGKTMIKEGTILRHKITFPRGKMITKTEKDKKIITASKEAYYLLNQNKNHVQLNKRILSID